MKLIIGLGNPGKDYEWTRHNIGFLVLKNIAETLKVKFQKSSFTDAFESRVKIQQQDVCLFLPMTFMNRSGIAVKQALDSFQVLPEDILVVCDDFNLPFGQLRIRPDGSSGGHNGLKSIVQSTQTEGFARLRVGVGWPVGGIVDYVLDEFSVAEKKELDFIIKEAAECCSSWLDQDIEKVMEKYNRKK